MEKIHSSLLMILTRDEPIHYTLLQQNIKNVTICVFRFEYIILMKNDKETDEIYERITKLIECEYDINNGFSIHSGVNYKNQYILFVMVKGG